MRLILYAIGYGNFKIELLTEQQYGFDSGFTAFIEDLCKKLFHKAVVKKIIAHQGYNI